MNTGRDVESFMAAADQIVPDKLHPFSAQSDLYLKLIIEEFNELKEAYEQKDYANIGKEGIDLVWVIEGLLISLGIPRQLFWAEVSRSNHSKVSESGKVLKREDGKVIKPSYYSPADVQTILKHVNH